jgi:predicted ribosome quality control (RQC) complex YloA/Tae2 family protein
VSSKGRPFRTLDVDGFQVLVGKSDADNDRLTFEFAEPDDVWMHVAGYSGSHVVVRNPEHLPAIPRAVLERAAELAAWYSKGRDAGGVEVHVCRAGDVSKPRGFPAGKVLLARWTRLRVHPKDPSDVPGGG